MQSSKRYTGWWYTYPLENMSSSVGMIIPYTENKIHVPNHQRVYVLCPILSQMPMLFQYHSRVTVLSGQGMLGVHQLRWRYEAACSRLQHRERLPFHGDLDIHVVVWPLVSTLQSCDLKHLSHKSSWVVDEKRALYEGLQSFIKGSLLIDKSECA